MKKHYITAFCLLVVAVAVVFAVTPIYRSMHTEDYIKKGPGVTETRMLSTYYPGLKGTPGDTMIHILDSGVPGGTVYIGGGTHANEPSGIVAAALFVENVKVTKGRLFVIVHNNASAITHTDYTEGTPQVFQLQTPDGARTFRYGSRATSPTHQWPDPDVYVHASSGQQLSGSEVRNLNRAHPGKPDGTITEKIAYAIAEMIRQEKIGMSVDLHEASPEYPVINAMVAHERAMDVAAEAVMELEMDGVDFRLEPSPKKLHGLSHREWGDHTETLAILMETANPAQGRIRGITDQDLIVTGADKMYQRVAPLGKLFVPFDEKGHPLSQRVARHATALGQLVRVYSSHYPDKAVEMEGLPDYETISTRMNDYLVP